MDDLAEVFAGAGALVVINDDEASGGGHLVAPAEGVTPERLVALCSRGSGTVSVAVDGAVWSRLSGELAQSAQLQTAHLKPTHLLSVDLVGQDDSDTYAGWASTISAIVDAHPGRRFASPGHVTVVNASVCPDSSVVRLAVDAVVAAGGVGAALLTRLSGRANPAEPARGREVFALATEYGYPVVTVSALQALARLGPVGVVESVSARLPLVYGMFDAVGFSTVGGSADNLALVHGDMTVGGPVSVSIHTECPLGDLFGSSACTCRRRLDDALRLMSSQSRGAVVYFRRTGPASSMHHSAAPIRSLSSLEVLFGHLGIRDITVAPTSDPVDGLPVSEEIVLPA
ncbi:3,4-dihydroxy-2-butanone-4-phosphate synthase [Gordonia rhizosphera]|uniref:3,4-dihydroxy-2-butanone-4-phosphate synthase n=1 Tax=Gordonia rhizosphera NBRC 16068 TaxID=1108045 RepID=K6VVU9_9ACTN|nr:3,4-dihydroxy-2-butanone-4-phosphate synthase [Gordonia rhizosphera]GAB91030.1 riboflavin biosynthesis protein RibBA [Gordonia rhizosphera NBRC 16068]